MNDPFRIRIMHIAQMRRFFRPCLEHLSGFISSVLMGLSDDMENTTRNLIPLGLR